MQPKLSLSDTTLSKIREVFKKVKDLPDVSNLCIGDPAGDPPAEVIEAYIRSIRENGMHYENDTGLPKLREAIAAYEGKLRNQSFHPYDNLVISNGGTNGIYSFSRAVLDPGDEVLLLDPVWIAFIQITRLLRCKPVMVPTKFENNFVPDPSDLKKLLTKRTKVLVVVSPSNPSGAVYNKDEMKMMLDFCIKHGIWLLHDEAYRDIVYGNHEQASFVGEYPNVVGVRTLSKSHNMAGARVGWVISSNTKLITRVRKNIAYNVMCVNTPAQYAALTAIEKCSHWLQDNVNSYYERMQYAYKRLTDMGFELHWPKGTFYLFPKHHYKRSIADEILQEEKVAVIDGRFFGKCGKDHIRISCSVSHDVLVEGLNRLENWVSKNKKNG